MMVRPWKTKKIDEIDVFLSKEGGKIQRPMNPRLCHHNSRHCCTSCLPLDPFDEDYLREKDIKHMSFHAYVRKLNCGHGDGTQLNKPLETVNCKLKPGCVSHKPFPKGICGKCRPSAITLNRQRYRHVDNILIENEEVCSRFLAFWRKTNSQRIGYLIGRYQSFSEVPLGIKATVAAIYEPPQTSSTGMVELLDDPRSKIVEQVCWALKLQVVGWIFTDLWCSDASKGTVRCIRNENTFLLSAQECITSGWLQNKHPNVTNFCTEGVFGSKFVTVVASGDESEHIHFSGYQVSNQCAALVDADLLCPTQYPELAYLRAEPLCPTHFIPDVHYMEKNEYGVEILRDCRPMPVEYLLVDVPTGMPKEPSATFNGTKRYFPIENRSSVGELQDARAVFEYTSQFSTENFLELATDFHFLLFLATSDIMKFTKEDLEEIFRIVEMQDRETASNWASSSSSWATFMALCQQDEFPVNDNGDWSCSHCTFKNGDERIDCAMCGLPHAV